MVASRKYLLVFRSNQPELREQIGGLTTCEEICYHLLLGFSLHGQKDRVKLYAGDGVLLRVEVLTDFLKEGMGGSTRAAHECRVLRKRV